MGQTTIVLMLITILSKILGFVRESVMAAYIGAGELKSIYTTATTIPTLFINVVVIGISSGFIPSYNKVLNEKGREKADDFTSNLINVNILIGLIFFFIVFVFSKQISKILSPDLFGTSLDLASDFTKISIIGVFAFVYSSIIKGYLNIYGNFIDPVVTGLILNVFVIISTIISAKLGNPYILIIGTLLGNVIQYIRFPFASKKLGFKYSKILDFEDEYIRYILLLSFPIMISTAADSISLIIDNSMASAFFGVSSVSKIFYAKSMLNFILTVVTISITTVSFPSIAKAGQSNNLNEMKSLIYSSNIYAALLVVPATFGMMALSHPIIRLAFERNAFTASDTAVVSALLFSYGPYIIFSSIIKIFQNGFYSVGDAKTPLFTVVILQILNVIFNIIFSRIFGLKGLAYATSLSTGLGSLLLIWMFRKKFGTFENRNGIKTIIKIIIGSLLTSIIAIIIYSKIIFSFSLVITLGITVGVSAMFYLYIMRILNIAEFDYLISVVRDKFKRKK